MNSRQAIAADRPRGRRVAVGRLDAAPVERSGKRRRVTDHVVHRRASRGRQEVVEAGRHVVDDVIRDPGTQEGLVVQLQGDRQEQCRLQFSFHHRGNVHCCHCRESSAQGRSQRSQQCPGKTEAFISAVVHFSPGLFCLF